MTIKEKVIPDQQLVLINYKGSVEDIDILISQIIDWAEMKKIEISGPPFAIFYNQANSVNADERVFDVGFPVNYKNKLTEGKIQIVSLLEHKVLSIIHEDSYDSIKDSYEKMIQYSIKNKYDIIGSPKEIFLTFKRSYNEENSKVEIQFPVIYMGD